MTVTPRLTSVLMLSILILESMCLRIAEAAQTVGPDLLDRPPAFDFALVALERTLDLPSGAALTLFALGRMVGWTGHMIEQYEEGQVIRPRAQYVGPPPETGVE